MNNLHATIGVAFRLPNQPDLVIECVVDTGFEGALAVPEAAVLAMGLPYLTDITANLANDASVSTPVHGATIVWNGIEAHVAVLAMGRRPLLGTALLAEHELLARFTDNGTVAVRKLSEAEQ